MSLAHHTNHLVSNGDSWQLEVKQCRPPKPLKKRNPVLIVPGYGMNSFIFGYHPRGLSFEEYLTQHGFEVWSANLRCQGGSLSENPQREEENSFKKLAAIDLPAVLEFVSKNSRSETGLVDVIGCSLGGTIAYTYLALTTHSLVGSLVTMGAPLRWEEVHTLMKILFASPKIAGMIPIVGTRSLARLLFPLISKTSLMNIYLHKEIVDLSHQNILMETIENPNRFLNREIAEWIQHKDLVVEGKNITQALKKVKNPLLCVLANADGIVPPMTALSAHEVIGSKVKDTLVVGTDELRFAHADLFISDYSHEMVFKPIAEWLQK
ncbi:MAG: alpha/beta fold hydrolase [Deltaproteobacteria bacterium]|nr:MAG: alpha/beta fold hydrolase [Deltaproteobacteria bacterium]